MTSKMNIHVSGGTASFGAVSQGDAAKVWGAASVTREDAEDRLRSAEHALRTLADALGKTSAEVGDVLAQIDALKERAVSAPGKVEEGMDILKTVRENFVWAYPLVKDFAKAVWPVVVGAIGG